MTDPTAILRDLRRLPFKAVHWHRLCHWLGLHPERREQLLQTVRTELPLQGRAGFLRASFLLLMTQDASDLPALRAALEEDTPTLLEESAVFEMLLLTTLLSRSASHAQAQAWVQRLDIGALLARQALRVGPPGRFVDPTAADSAGDGIRRVLVVAPALGRLSNPPTQLVHDHVRLLQHLGLQVRLLSPGRVHEPGRHCGVPIQHPFDDFLPAEWNGEPAVDVSTGAARQDLLDRWRTCMAQCREFAPDAVLFIGLGSPGLHLLRDSYPVVALGTTGLPPQGPADVWLCSVPPTDTAGRVDEVESALPVEYAYRVRRKAAPVEVVPRSALGPPERALLLVSSGVRLQEEIGGDWLQRMTAVLQRHPQLQWVLVGSPRRPASVAALGDRVTHLPHQRDLGSVLVQCDIYLNPPRLGGGFSVAEAMACGLAVLSHADSDGGDKLGPWAAADDAGYFAELEALIVSAERRQARGRAMQARFAQALDLASAGPALMQALRQAQARFRRRTRPSGS